MTTGCGSGTTHSLTIPPSSSSSSWPISPRPGTPSCSAQRLRTSRYYIMGNFTKKQPKLICQSGCFACAHLNFVCVCVCGGGGGLQAVLTREKCTILPPRKFLAIQYHLLLALYMYLYDQHGLGLMKVLSMGHLHVSTIFCCGNLST